VIDSERSVGGKREKLLKKLIPLGNYRGIYHILSFEKGDDSVLYFLFHSYEFI